MLEQKVKQAAQSLYRLENAANKRQRISHLPASTHLDTAQKKCDEINTELWRLSSLSMEVERKLLNHNAAVLGLGMSILEKKAMEIGMTDEFGEGHLYLSNDSEEKPSTRFSMSEKRSSMIPPPVEFTEAQNRLRQLNSYVASISRSGLSTPSGNDNILSYIEQLERNIRAMTDSHSTVTNDLQTSLSESQQMIEQLKLRERDQSAAIIDATARSEDLERRLIQTQKEFDRVQNELDDQYAMVENLRQDLELAREEARIAENAAQRWEVESLGRGEADRLNNELAQRDGTIAKLSQEISILRDHHESVQRDTDDLHSKFKDQSRQHDMVVRDLESQVVMLKSETAMLKAEKDEMLGSRQQRAEQARLEKELEEQRSQPQDQLLQELESLKKRNSQLSRDLEISESERSASEDILTRQIITLEQQLADPDGISYTSASSSTMTTMTDGSREKELEARCNELQSELSSILDDFERLTSQFIDHESFRQTLEAQVDALRAQCHTVQTELAEQKVRMLGRNGDVSSPAVGGGNTEQTSTLTLRKEFRKMVAEMRNEHISALKVLY